LKRHNKAFQKEHKPANFVAVKMFKAMPKKLITKPVQRGFVPSELAVMWHT